MRVKRTIFSIVLTAVFAIALVPMTTDYAAGQLSNREITIELDGNALPVNALLHNGEVLLPLRAVAERLGRTVNWDDALRRVCILAGRRTQVSVTIGRRGATVSGNAMRLDAPPRLIDSRTFVSLCFFADTMGIGTGFKHDTVILSTRPAARIPVLLYHHLLPDALNVTQRNNGAVISVENFEQQMRYLYDNNFYTPTLDELEAFLLRGRPLPRNSVMIHFDDGYYSNFVYAYPILQRYGLRAVLFFITHLIEDLGDYQPELCYDGTTFTAAHTIKGTEDVFETASHSHNMHRLVPGSQNTILYASTRDAIRRDTLRSFDFVGNHRAYAYPRGQRNETVIAGLQDAGITMAFTTTQGYVTARSDPMALERFIIWNTTSIARFRSIVNIRL